MKVRERLYMMIMTKNWMNGSKSQLGGSWVWGGGGVCVCGGVKIKVK